MACVLYDFVHTSRTRLGLQIAFATHIHLVFEISLMIGDGTVARREGHGYDLCHKRTRGHNDDRIRLQHWTCT